MLRPRRMARKTPTWPTPVPEQVEVVILGTYHMANPGLDAVNVESDDVLSDRRQGELEAFVDTLVGAAPELVTVERPATQADQLVDRYHGYRDGEYAYDEPYEFERGEDDEYDPVDCRSEVVQVGFRLADRLGHDRVAPVDVPESLGDEAAEADLEEREHDPTAKRDVSRLDPDELKTTQQERLATSSVTGYHRFLNEEAALHANDAMFDRFIRRGAGENYAGPDALADWYRRNLRMVHNIWQAVEETDRVLCLVGSGHVHILRQLLTETPQFCPLSALPYLPADG